MLLAALARHACVSCQRVLMRVFSLSQSCRVSYHRAYMCTHCRAWSRVFTFNRLVPIRRSCLPGSRRGCRVVAVRMVMYMWNRQR